MVCEIFISWLIFITLCRGVQASVCSYQIVSHGLSHSIVPLPCLLNDNVLYIIEMCVTVRTQNLYRYICMC